METLSLQPESQETDAIARVHALIGNGLTVAGRHDEVLAGADGLYLSAILPPAASEITISGIEALRPEDIKDVEPLRFGATDSQHEVRFASVNITKGDGEEMVTHVAIKYLEGELENAVIECESLMKVSERRLDALAPVGILKDGEDGYLITLLRPDIISLDNANWTPRPGEVGFEEVIENLNFIGESLGRLHARGIFHGDAQPKNFARSDIGEYVVIDLEKGCDITSTEEDLVAAFLGNPSISDSRALHDLKMFWMTLNRPTGIGLNQENVFLGSDPENEEIYNVVKDHFLNRYIDTIRQQVTPELYAKLSPEIIYEAMNTHMMENLGLK